MKLIRYKDSHGKIAHAALQPDGSALQIARGTAGSPRVTKEKADVAKLLAPIEPSAIICIGLNYRGHARETGAAIPEFPVIFFKGINALQHPGRPILLPQYLKSEQVDFECELAVVIGHACKNVPRAKALDYVLGYCCANDVSARDWQIKRGGGQWGRGKTFDTFCPLGPCLVTRDEIRDPNSLRIRTLVNGEVMQDANTSDMIFDVPALIEFLSGSTTLLPRTVILTGTPQGVGMGRKPPRYLRPGDTVSVDIERIGTLTNPIALEPV
jgi:2-keto-4-pentenoate hydratase/2-oxohepta-3-ene-1,7-dioic acid hydratase in catechol pathway